MYFFRKEITFSNIISIFILLMLPGTSYGAEDDITLTLVSFERPEPAITLTHTDPNVRTSTTDLTQLIHPISPHPGHAAVAQLLSNNTDYAARVQMLSDIAQLLGNNTDQAAIARLLSNNTDPNLGDIADINPDYIADPNPGDNADPNPGDNADPNPGDNADPNPGDNADPNIADNDNDGETPLCAEPFQHCFRAIRLRFGCCKSTNNIERD